MSIISLKNVSLKRQNKVLLKHLNWEAKQGEVWVILGLNGSGKTTLLKLLTAEYFPSDGDMTILGKRFGHEDITSIRRRIGIVGSFISERLPKHMLAEKIVLTGRYKSSILYSAYQDSDIEDAKNMLRLLKGEELIGRPYFSLSQGEKQLVLIARSLMDEPDIIVLD